MAFEKLPANQAVIDRVLTRTAEMGAQAGFLAIRKLRPYTGENDIFNIAQVRSYGRRIADETEEKYLEERIAGRHNDTESKRPGLTALVTEHAKNRIEEVFAVNSQGNLFGVEVAAVEDLNERQLFIVRLPEGGYAETSPMAMKFIDVVEPVGEQDVRVTATASSSVRTSTYDVVTIVGDAGEYWQNPNLNLDGTPR